MAVRASKFPLHMKSATITTNQTAIHKYFENSWIKTTTIISHFF